MEHHTNIVPGTCWRPSTASSCAGYRSPTTANSSSPTSSGCSTAAGVLSFTAMAQRARHDHPGSPTRCRPPTITGAIAVVDACRVRAAPRHRREGLGRRLRRVQRPGQLLRPVGIRRAVAAEMLSTRCHLHRGRRRDLPTSAWTGHVCRAAGQVERRAPTVAEAIGLGAAIDYLGRSASALRCHEK